MGTQWKFRLAGMLLAMCCWLSAADYQLEPAGTTESDAVLAEVNGFPITLSDVLFESWREEARAYAVLTPAELEKAIADIRKNKLTDLIDRRLVIADFQRHEYRVDNRYVEQVLDRMAREMGCADRIELSRRARDFNSTMEQLRTLAGERLMNEMMLSNLLYEQVNITPYELHCYIAEREADFRVPARIRFRLLRIGTNSRDRAQRLADVAKALESPAAAENFAGIVTHWSDGPAAAQGGDLGWIEQSRVRREFAALLGDAPEIGRIYGPLEIPDEGVFYLQVLESTVEQAPDRAALQQELRAKLEEEARQKVVHDYLSKLRANALIHFAR